MFQENLKTYRKAKGLTQEDLAVRLHVVRQTISKWEKGLSVPDAALLVRLSEVLEVPVSQLLGAPLPPESSTDQVAEQLARINEQLAQKNRRARRIWQVVVGILLAFVLLWGILCLLSYHSYTQYVSTKNSGGAALLHSGRKKVLRCSGLNSPFRTAPPRGSPGWRPSGPPLSRLTTVPSPATPYRTWPPGWSRSSAPWPI